VSVAARALARVLELLPDAVVVIDEGLGVRWANRAAEELFGRSLADWEGRSGAELVHPADMMLVVSATETVQGKAVGTPIEVRVATPEGWRLVEVLGRNALGDPEVGGIVLVLRDLTDRRRWEIAHDDAARFRALVSHSPAMSLLIRGDGRVVAASAAVTRVLGHDPELIEGATFADLVYPEDRDLVRAAFELADREGVASQLRPATTRVRLMGQDGMVALVAELAIVSMAGDLVMDGYVVGAQDVTALVETHQALSTLARLDPLTGLPNRAALIEHVTQQLETIGAGEPLTVLFLDLDGFKQVNDAFGHDVGDQMLAAVASRFRESLRPDDYLARFGGDEFVVAARIDAAGAASLVHRLQQVLAEGIDTPLGPTRLGVSVGVAPARAHDTAGTLVGAADADMYTAKRARAAAAGDQGQHG
jgi:diguanylate cyclase (GGDEF)-like protein/PAS domain S-box-containing protein